MLVTTTNTHAIERCGRCAVVLTAHEIDNQRYDDRFRCHGCDNPIGDTRSFLVFAPVVAPTPVEAEREWIRRVRIAETSPRDLVHRVDLHGDRRLNGKRIS